MNVDLSPFIYFSIHDYVTQGNPVRYYPATKVDKRHKIKNMGKVIRFDLIIHAVLQNKNEYIRVELHQALSQVNFFIIT